MVTQPLAPESFQTFGELLRFLRRRERLTQLELSIAVGYSEAQIGRLEQNQRKPDVTAVKALFIPALHLEDEIELAQRLLELAQFARQEDAPAPGVTPYKGLLFFDQADANLFFGRETLTTHLVDRVTALDQVASRFLAVVGASGSGKSSLVRAGLAVTLQRLGWNVHIFTPTTHPLEMLVANDPSSGAKYGQHLIVVDQFEESFTLCHDESERLAFIERLMCLAQDQAQKVTIVIALRADFYSHCAQYPLLREAVAAEQEYIGQMTQAELRRAIEEPAKRGGWEFERGLIDVLLNDIGADGAGQPEPGALPLLSHALLATWERRHGRTLTLEGYRASGGVRGAIAETAESVFTDQLNRAQQDLARDIFLRLTELGEGAEDTRRRATLNELARQSEETMTLRAVLNTLADARLITLNEDTAEVAHEALIREWQRLHEWLTADREGLRLHRHLTDAALEWEARGHDASELYRGARLAQTNEWAAVYAEHLNVVERTFLAASIEQEQHEAIEREAHRQRELEAAQRLAETERQSALRLRRRNRALAVAGALITVVAIVAVILGGQARAANVVADQQRVVAVNAQATAVANLSQSEAQRLAAEANKLMLNNGDTNLIALLTIRSLNTQYTPSGDAMLTSLTTLQSPPREFRGHTADLWGVAFSPDGKYLATGSSDKTARLWDIAAGETIRIFSGHAGQVEEVAFSPDGKYLATASADHTARLWDVSTGQTVQVFTQTNDVNSVAFSPDAKYLVTNGFTDNNARIWDIATGQTLHILTGHTNLVPRVAFSPDGKYVLTGSNDARLWDARTGEQIRIISMPSGTESLTFSPDSKYIAVGNSDHVARIWEIATGKLVREFSGHQGFVTGIRFSPDSRFLFTGSTDRTARLWDLATGQTIRVFAGHANAVQTVTFSPDGQRVATASNDGMARVWNLQTFPGGRQFTRHDQPISQASFSPDGKHIVTASDDGTARTWDAITGQAVITISGPSGVADSIRSADFSADGKRVLTASTDGTARLWDAASGKELRRFEGHTDWVNRAIFSPDGKYIVTTSWDGTARVWDTQTAQTLMIYTGQGPGHVNRVAFSPDGKSVATSGDDATARIWDPLTGRELMVFKGHTDLVRGVAFSLDGKYLATASQDGSVRLWDVAIGKEVRRLAGHPGGADDAAFSADGKYVLSGGVDGTARLWDVVTGNEVRRFTGHTDEVGSVTFSPDGKYILTASRDGTSRLWLIDLQDAIRAACGVLTRDLTSEERTQFNISDQGQTCLGQ